MDYAQARRKARFMFGGSGDVRARAGSLGPVYIVGVMQLGVFKALGSGLSWSEAFNSVKEVVHGKGEGSGEEAGAVEGVPEDASREAGEAGLTSEAPGPEGNRPGTTAPTGHSPTGVHRIKL